MSTSVPPTTYTSNPSAARILSRLVEYGYAPDDPPVLPPDWQLPFEAVLRNRAYSRRIRFDAFRNALLGLPHAYEMLEEVVQLNDAVEDRADRNRLLYSAKDALHDPPILEWCVDGFFALPSLNLLVGDSGTKKTFLAIDLAVSVAAGQPWLGHPVQQAPVLFIDEETGLHRLWGRLNASLRAHQAAWDTPLNFISLGGYDLRNEEDAEALTNRALSVDARLIVIDSLANLMRGAAENNLGAVQPVLFHLRRMAEHCRAAVVAVHHTNRQGAFRGSSSIAASADLMLSIESQPGQPSLTLRTIKTRFVAPDPLIAHADFTPSPDGKDRVQFTVTDGTPVSAAPPVAINSQPGISLAILDYLSANPTATRRQLTAHLSDFNPGSVRNALVQLTRSGLIKRANDGHRGAKALYALAK